MRSLHESHGMEQQVDHFQCSEDVYGVLEDLQEAIYDYQVRSWPLPAFQC